MAEAAEKKAAGRRKSAERAAGPSAATSASAGAVAQVIAGGAASGLLASKFSSLFSGAPPAPAPAAGLRPPRRVPAQAAEGAQPAAAARRPRAAESQAAAPQEAAGAKRRAVASAAAAEHGGEPRAAASRQEPKARERGKPAKGKAQLSREELQEREARTVFVGNVPLGMEKKQFRQMMKTVLGDTYTGKLDPIWFRDIPVEDKWSGKLRKAGAILGDYAKNASDAKSAYVVVDSPDVVQAVCRKIHGHEADARHLLRADGVGEASKLQSFDRKRSVFVGNLPANVGEADLRAALASAGEVQAVRIVRDKASKTCKGFAFVLFKERKHVKGALNLWGVEVLGRPIRVMKVEKQGADADWDGGGGGGPQKRKLSDPAVARFVELRRQKKFKKRTARAAKRKAEATGGGGAGKKQKDKRHRGKRRG